MPLKKDFDDLIDLILTTAIRDGKKEVVLNALQLHKVFGSLPDGSHRMPQCCNAMRDAGKRYKSEVVSESKNDSTRFSVKYSFD